MFVDPTYYDTPASFSYGSCLVKAGSVAQANQPAQQLTAEGFYVNRGGGEATLPRALALLKQAKTGGAIPETKTAVSQETTRCGLKVLMPVRAPAPARLSNVRARR